MFGGLFDFNRDGKVDAGEFAVGMAILEGIDEADQRDELDAEGLDYDELPVFLYGILFESMKVFL